MDRIAVVILNWNGKDMLRRFLPSVMQYSKGATIYVADNSSTDGSVKMLSEEFQDVKVLEFDRNYGFAEGYNRALEGISAEYFILLNSDVEVTEGWLGMIDYLDNHEDVLACQPKLLSYSNKSAFEYSGAAGGFLDRFGYPFCRGRIFSSVEEDCGQYDDITDLFWATGACLAIRRDAFREAGGLDGRFFAHMEEIDLCWRLRARGGRIVCVPSSKVYHVGGATLSKSSPRKTYLNYRNNLLMLYKNLPDDELSSVMGWRMLLDGIAAISFLVKGHLGDFKAVFRARWDYLSMRGLYADVRRKNLALSTFPVQKERMGISILREYYISRIRTFDRLVNK